MHVCLVCGYTGLEEPPRGASGGGSYEICPCCGFQYGVDDDDRGLSYEQAREKWLESGKQWYSKSRKAPQGWNAETQLKQLTGESNRKTSAKNSAVKSKPVEVVAKKNANSKVAKSKTESGLKAKPQLQAKKGGKTSKESPKKNSRVIAKEKATSKKVATKPRSKK